MCESKLYDVPTKEFSGWPESMEAKRARCGGRGGVQKIHGNQEPKVWNEDLGKAEKQSEKFGGFESRVR